MKAVIVDSSVRQSLHGIKNDSRSTAGKTSPTSKQTDFDSNEMRECFHQLQKMLPRYQGERWSDHVDKTELLQRVIDYIVDLRMLLVLDRGSCIFGSGRGSRKPLADRTGGDNTKHNFKTDRVSGFIRYTFRLTSK